MLLSGPDSRPQPGRKVELPVKQEGQEQDHVRGTSEEQDLHVRGTSEEQDHVRGTSEEQDHVRGTSEEQDLHVRGTSEEQDLHVRGTSEEQDHVRGTSEEQDLHVRGTSEEQDHVRGTSEEQDLHVRGTSEEQDHVRGTSEEQDHVRGTSEEQEVSQLESSSSSSSSSSCSSSCSSSSPDAVTGESFCQCELQAAPGHGAPLRGLLPAADCLCGEEDDVFQWLWEATSKSSEASLSCEGRKASFHADYSCGTAAIRGTEALVEGQHFWEIKMTSLVYGTDMMVGVGTSEVNLDKFRYSFCSLLGNDEDSWGLSYTGLLQHAGTKEMFSPRFGQGSIIGVHLDTWHGTLTFYKNRRFIGVATTRLQNKAFYPMVCSTAANSSMKVIRACRSPTSLQYLCCARIRKQMPRCPDVLRALDLPPGLFRLLQSQLGWVFNLPQGPQQRPEDAVVDDFTQDTTGPRSSRGPVSTQSASASPGPVDDTPPCLWACRACPQVNLDPGGTCVCPPTPPSSDCESSCSSEPEDYQSKRGRWI